MNVALVLWPIGQEGGIATRTLEAARVLREGGHEATVLRVAYSNVAEARYNERLATTGDGFRVGGRPLPIYDAALPASLNRLRQFDHLNFLHPAPHLSDRQKAVGNWRSLYDHPSTSVVFTDVYAPDFYPWISEVRYGQAFGVNSAALRVARRYSPTARLLHAAMPQVERYVGDRDRTVVWNHAWRSWKGVRLLLDAAPNIDARVLMAGVGRERRTADKEGKLRTVDAPGQVDYLTMRKEVAHAALAVDLTGASPKYHGHYNRSTIEPMLLGTPVLARPQLAHPASPLPLDCILPWTPDISLADTINFYLSRPKILNQIADNAYAWATGMFTDEAALADLLPTT